jgi:hypothetical protein
MTREQSWNEATDRMQAAFTEAEIAAAAEAMRQHLTAWPQDSKREPWHGWGDVVASAKERRADSERLGLIPLQHGHREELIRASHVPGDYIAEASVIERMREVAEMLREWLDGFPEDTFVAERLRLLRRDIQIVEESRALVAAAEDRTPLVGIR